MTRWKESLCGSVLKVAPAENASSPLGQPSEVLSCGGCMVSNPVTRLSFRPIMLHLPKEDYEVILYVPNDNAARFSSRHNLYEDEIEMIEGVLDYLEYKNRD